MPRITININDPDSTTEQDIITLDLPPGLSIADLKGFVEAETKLPASSQHFFLDGQKITQDNQTIENAGIKDGEMLAMLVSRGGPSQQQRQAAQGQSQPRSGQRGFPTVEEVENVRLQILNEPRAMQQVQEQKPELAAAVHDRQAFYNAWVGEYRASDEREKEKVRQIELLNEDPFNVEAQTKIEEMIREERVMENLQHAYEHSPEVFARVTMLYIPVEVNNHPIKAFVDSGAQATIMSPSAAERCGIMRLIDKRFSGIAKGVGTARIIGRVHSAEMKIGNAVMPCAFTVMEGKDVDLLLGLDMLKRYQACIDLKHNKLVLGEGNEVHFLPESELPKEQEALVNEPSIPGPAGTQIGAKTGAVRPAGAQTPSAIAAGPSSSSNVAFQGQGRTLGSNSASQQQQLQQQQQQQQRQPAQPFGSQAQHPPEKIDQLVAIGFSKEEAVNALNATDGDVELAAGFLFN